MYTSSFIILLLLTINGVVFIVCLYSRSEATAPYELRNVRISSAESYSVLASAQRVRITHPSIPVFVNRGPARVAEISEDMRRGRIPGGPGGPARRLLQSNPKLLLVSTDFGPVKFVEK
jgi:hypothetical protein